MKSDLPGAQATVGPVVAGIIMVTVRLLPQPQRDRYEAEFRAELVGVPPHRRVVQAASLLIGAPSLRRALLGTPGVLTERAHRDWRCRVGRHRDILVQDDNPENRKSQHLECTRCLRVKDIKEYEPAGDWFTKGGPYIS